MYLCTIYIINKYRGKIRERDLIEATVVLGYKKMRKRQAGRCLFCVATLSVGNNLVDL